jgi:dienelactone hydrolase
VPQLLPQFFDLRFHRGAPGHGVIIPSDVCSAAAWRPWPGAPGQNSVARRPYGSSRQSPRQHQLRQQFGNLIHHAYPGDDFYDLNSGVDAVVAKGYIDPNRLYVGGGSGGVLTAWMIGRSTRFRAAVSYYPVINRTSWTLNSDIPITGWFPGNPWDHPDHHWKRSLLSVVKNVKTPCMVITGEQDWRTPMSESEQYYTALKLLKVDSVLVRVPAEPHGIRRRPSHWRSCTSPAGSSATNSLSRGVPGVFPRGRPMLVCPVLAPNVLL